MHFENKSKQTSKAKLSKNEIIGQKSKDLLLTTSMHGIQNIIRTNNSLIRIIWIICVLASVTVCAYLVCASILKYYKYEIVTKISSVYEQQSQFPALSICAPKSDLTNESILECMFNSNNCSEYFETFSDEIYGLCFRFNAGLNLMNKQVSVLNSTVGGVYHGLVLDIYAKNRLNDFTELAVYIHNKSFKPFNLVNRGFRFTSGTITTFMIERIFDEKLEYPYNDCLKDINDFSKNKTIINYFKQTNYNYSQIECIRYCRNLMIMEQSVCNCIKSFDSVDECARSSNQTIKECYHNFYSDFQKRNVFDLCSNYCPLECDSFVFSISLNTVPLPTNGNISAKNEFPSRFQTYEKLQQEFFRIKAYFPELKFTYIKQEANFLFIDLISNIGGTLGLFLGISFLSFVEVLELFIEILLVIIRKRT